MSKQQLIEYINENNYNRTEELVKVDQLLSISSKIKLGIHGSWGSGKTIFGEMLKLISEISLDSIDNDLLLSNIKFINDSIVILFDASKEDIFNNPLLSILKVSIDRFEELNIECYKKSEEKPKSLFKQIVDVVEGIKIESEENEFDDYYNTSKIIDKIKKLFDIKRNIVLIIDELDRCDPKYTLRTLNVIKHFFEIDNLAIIYLYNYEELWHVISNEYGYKNEIYLQKC